MLEGKVALVTGAGRGIGRAIALKLAGYGADVAVNYSGSAVKAEETATEIRALGRRAVRMSEAEFDQVIDTNLKGAFFCMKLAGKQMMKKRYGRIVSISSISGVRGNAGQINYCAAKAGIIGMTKCLAKELAVRNVTVNAIAPGYIDTDMTAVLSDKVKEAALSQVPLGRMGQPEDIAEAVAFLASDRAAYITGQTIQVDGGMGI